MILQIEPTIITKTFWEAFGSVLGFDGFIF